MKRTDTEHVVDSDDMVDNYIIDSSAWIEFFLGGVNANRFWEYIEKANSEHYFTPVIIIYEVFKKIYRDVNEEEAFKAIAYIKYSTKVIDLTDEIAISSAENSVKEKLPMADAIIFTTAQKFNSILVTGDDHFKGKEKIFYFGE